MTGTHGTWLAAGHALLLRDSTDELWARTAVWLTAAALRGELLVYVRCDRDPLDGLATRFATSLDCTAGGGRALLIDVGTCRRATGGTVEGLADWARDLVARARRLGLRGVALTGDPDCCRGAVPHEPPDVVERCLDALADRLPVRVLCRHDPAGRPAHVLDRLLRQHHRHVDATRWGADAVDGRLHVVGELDAADARHAAEVARAATATGTAVDLAGARPLGPAAAAVLAALAGTGQPEPDRRKVHQR